MCYSEKTRTSPQFLNIAGVNLLFLSNFRWKYMVSKVFGTNLELRAHGRWFRGYRVSGFASTDTRFRRYWGTGYIVVSHHPLDEHIYWTWVVTN